MTEYWYRYEDWRTAAPLDEWERPIGGGGIKISLRKYEVLHYTPKGVKLDMGTGFERFVLRDARKRFACPTIEEAKESFMSQKNRQLRILEAQAANIRRVITKAEEEL